MIKLNMAGAVGFPKMTAEQKRVETIEAAMLAAARDAVIRGGHYLTAAELAPNLQLSPMDVEVSLRSWKTGGAIFSITVDGSERYPAFALDARIGYHPIPALAEVLEIFVSVKDCWGTALWFSSSCSYLGGARPQDVLASEPERVIVAARDEAAGILHE